MNCPNCDTIMEIHLDVGGPESLRQCPLCWLAGTPDVIGELAKLKSPEHVLAEAERLLRESSAESGYIEATLFGNQAAISDRYDGVESASGATLFEAYSKMVEARHG